HIIGTERHESRRIDNQLRGRSGRQGDPGSSRFYLSLEDNLMRIFASDWVQRAMRGMGMKEDDVIESALVTKQIANAQRKVEAHNFDIRKNLLEFDDVANDQRKVVYQQRNELLESDSVQDAIEAIRDDILTELVRRHVPAESIDEQWDLPALERSLAEEFSLQVDLRGMLKANEELDADGVLEAVLEAGRQLYAEKESQLGPEMMRHLEKHLMLNVLDQNWKEHLARMDYLRQGIHLRGYAQKQPKQEYKRESFELFSEMLDKVKYQVTSLLARVRIRSEEEIAAMEAAERQRQEARAKGMQFQHPETGGYGTDEEAEQAQAMAAQGQGVLATPQRVVREGPKIGRNDPCPCGSGKKYKQCHGRLA
ncbi:MAG TPA: SEC-C metal-binding domain-containing protein, partial [Arenimonas sp.]|nr:SEC-C metal-binding domain-containing protein [Arenimonas sp.]